jgi:hypothetical protein
MDCGAPMPFGPANDKPDVVKVEVRAAEIAALVKEAGRTARWSQLGCDGAEIAGWIECKEDSAKLPEQDGEWAGWLAFAIHDHDASHGGR